jgi:CheY-like chemotaxis protein
VKKRRVILLVEDDEGDVFFFRRALTSCKFDGDVRVVENAWEARDYIEGRGRFSDRGYFALPDLIVSDLHLPGASGVDFVKWVREHPEYRSIPIIVWSGSRTGKELQNILAAGASAYQVKTPEFNALCQNVEAMLQHLPKTAPEEK